MTGRHSISPLAGNSLSPASSKITKFDPPRWDNGAVEIGLLSGHSRSRRRVTHSLRPPLRHLRTRRANGRNISYSDSGNSAIDSTRWDRGKSSRAVDIGHVRHCQRLGQSLDDLPHVAHQLVATSLVHDRDVTGCQHPLIQSLARERLFVGEANTLDTRKGARRDGAGEVTTHLVRLLGIPTHGPIQLTDPSNRFVAFVPDEAKSPFGAQDTMNLGEGARSVEPVEGLRYEHDVDTRVRERDRHVAPVENLYARG